MRSAAWFFAAHLASRPTRVSDATSARVKMPFNARVIVTMLSHRHLTGAWTTLFERLANPYELISYVNGKCQKAAYDRCRDQA